MGLEAAGMTTAFQCEIDKHARAVLDHHWPTVPKWDDVTTLTGAYVLEQTGGVDIVAWGSPCQDLSVAGQRAGLAGAKSGLFHEGVRIIKELRELTNGKCPTWSLWENVPGALSSNGGADFGQVLWEMDEAGACFSEWAVLDAQYFGVPQRRRRVFVASCFDSGTAAGCSDPLFPVAESGGGDSAKGGAKGKAVAGASADSVGEDGATLNPVAVVEPVLAFDTQFGSNANVFENQSPTLKASQQPPSALVEPLIFQPGSMLRLNARPSDTTAPTLRAESKGGDNQPYVVQGEPLLIDGRRVDDGRVYEEPVQTLGARMGTDGNNVPMVASPWAAADNGDGVLSGSVTSKWRKGSGGPAGDEHYNLVVDDTPQLAVRRLTPLECERLMGWPDHHTSTGINGPISDSQRYKMCGNGVASPVAAWLGRVILNAGH